MYVLLKNQFNSNYVSTHSVDSLWDDEWFNCIFLIAQETKHVC